MQIDEEKLYQPYNEPDRLWTGGKAKKELHKITSVSKKDIKSWVAKQALWKVHITPPKQIHHPHYDVTKPNEQRQIDVLYMPHNASEGNMYKYILKGIDVGSRYTFGRLVKTKTPTELTFFLEAVYKRSGLLKYPRVT